MSNGSNAFRLPEGLPGLTRVDMHVHTEVSGDPWLRTESLLAFDERTRLVEHAKAAGLHAICLTEHDRIWPREAVAALSEKNEFPVFRGIEVTTNYKPFGHVLVFGLEYFEGGMHDIVRLREIVSREGGFMAVAHPFRACSVSVDGRHEDLVRQVLDTGPHALEAANGGNRAVENHFAAVAAQSAGLPTIGGSDAHVPPGIGSAFTLFSTPVTDEASLLRALLAGECMGVERDGCGLAGLPGRPARKP